MIPVVFDCNVVLAAVGWSGTPRRCLRLVAQRRLRLCVTSWIVSEYEAIIPERLSKILPEVNPGPNLVWPRRIAKSFEPTPLGKQRSRDRGDDPYLSCARAAQAKFIVTYDKDLLDLGKPFGIEVLCPAELLRRIEGG
jgi:putative PIN family toxin of toxin-antitoxin system